MAQFEKAILGGGCFWCVEAIYQRVKGVEKVVSGFAGGHVANPTYEQLHSMDTGHAEVIEITFDSSTIDYKALLEIFWHVHDPTTLNRQGNDVGPEYRSIILYTNNEQKAIAERTKREIAEEVWDDPIVTEIKPFDRFYAAEDYHQDFYNNNRLNPYCQVVINPKLKKFQKKFKTLLKDD